MTHAPLAPLAADSVDVLLAPDHGFAPQSSSDPLLRHKTTRRAEYDRAWHEAEALGAFDMLFFNERGELTEGGRTTVFAKLDGRWSTPPIDAGVLPGVMRAVLMEELSAVERTMTREELERAEALIVSNALRGAVKARLRLSKPLAHSNTACRAQAQAQPQNVCSGPEKSPPSPPAHKPRRRQEYSAARS